MTPTCSQIALMCLVLSKCPTMCCDFRPDSSTSPHAICTYRWGLRTPASPPHASSLMSLSRFRCPAGSRQPTLCRFRSLEPPAPTPFQPSTMAPTASTPISPPSLTHRPPTARSVFRRPVLHVLQDLSRRPETDRKSPSTAPRLSAPGKAAASVHPETTAVSTSPLVPGSGSTLEVPSSPASDLIPSTAYLFPSPLELMPPLHSHPAGNSGWVAVLRRRGKSHRLPVKNSSITQITSIHCQGRHSQRLPRLQVTSLPCPQANSRRLSGQYSLPASSHSAVPSLSAHCRPENAGWSAIPRATAMCSSPATPKTMAHSISCWCSNRTT